MQNDNDRPRLDPRIVDQALELFQQEYEKKLEEKISKKLAYLDKSDAFKKGLIELGIPEGVVGEIMELSKDVDAERLRSILENSELSLSISNELTKLPDEITDLENLDKMEFPSSNELTKLPDEITNLANPAKLEFPSSNELTKLPDEITDLANLTKTELPSNKLKRPKPPKPEGGKKRRNTM